MHTSRMRSLLACIVVAVCALGSLTACAPESSAPTGDASSSAAAAGPLEALEALSAVEIIDTLEAVPVAERTMEYTASVRPDRVILSDGSSETAVEIPDDLFYLSVAPYVDQTHECFFHSLTTCRGELGGATLDVTVTAEDGEVLVDETVQAADNGFVGLWLPRGIQATIEVSDGERSATADIATGADDPTCVTTLRMA